MSAEKRLEELGFELPPAPKAVGVYRTSLIVGQLCFTSGHVPLLPDGQLLTGCVGRDVDEQQGYQAARQCGLTILATLKRDVGLDRVQRVVKVFGLVNCTADFQGHPSVINGCSELFKEVFGDEAGIGTRSAVGANSLPLNVTAEIEAIFELGPENQQPA